jgi:hypothetical protein
MTRIFSLPSHFLYNLSLRLNVNKTDKSLRYFFLLYFHEDKMLPVFKNPSFDRKSFLLLQQCINLLGRVHDLATAEFVTPISHRSEEAIADCL